MKVPTAFVTTLGGDHVPVYGVALVDGFCKSGGTSFIHNGLITLNVGVSFGRMVTYDEYQSLHNDYLKKGGSPLQGFNLENLDKVLSVLNN